MYLATKYKYWSDLKFNLLTLIKNMHETQEYVLISRTVTYL